jgi:hypothetical protein
VFIGCRPSIPVAPDWTKGPPCPFMQKRSISAWCASRSAAILYGSVLHAKLTPRLWPAWSIPRTPRLSALCGHVAATTDHSTKPKSSPLAVAGCSEGCVGLADLLSVEGSPGLGSQSFLRH